MTLMLSQLFQLFAFLLLGMFARWKIIVDGSFPGGLSRVVVDFFLPCMLFMSVYDNLSLQTLQEERSAFLWGAASFLVTFPLYTFFARKLAKDPYEVGIFQYTFLVPNYGFFGYVLIEAVYGSQMLFHMVIFTIPHMIYGYTDVYRRLCGMEKLSLRTLCNPSVFAMLLGAACGMLQFRLPTAVISLLTAGKSCVGPLSMILTGMVIAGFRPADILKDRRVYLASALRPLILPAASLMMMKLLHAPRELLVVGAYFFAMPTGMNTILFPTMVNRDCRLGAGMALVSNISLIVTFPIILRLFL